jgi:hypothetical protein
MLGGLISIFETENEAPAKESKGVSGPKGPTLVSGSDKVQDFSFSPRSRASMVEEEQLRVQIETLRGLKAIAERRASEAEIDVKRLEQAIVQNPGESQLQVNLLGAEQAYQGQCGLARRHGQAIVEREEKILRLTPTEVESQARSAKQRQMAEGIEAREETRQEIRRVTDELSRLLSVYDEQTSDMARAAQAISLTMPGNDLEASFQKLRASLPAGQLFDTADRQGARFLGRPKNAKPYVVRIEYLAMNETLAHHGIYHFGETIFLEEKEAADLMSTDFSAGTHAAPWRSEPPAVMSPEAYDAMVRTAHERGVTAESLAFWSDAMRDRADKEWYRLNMKSRAQRRRIVAPENRLVFNSATKIQAKVTGNISLTPGSLCRIGEIIELSTVAAAWSASDSGAIGPP